jgi:transposase
MRAYSADLRERVLTECDGGMGTRAAARTSRVSGFWVRRLKQVRRATGRTAPAVRRTPAPGWAAHADAIRAAVAAAPDATPAESRTRFALPLSRSALARALIALGLSLKERRSGRPSRTGRT